LVRRPWREYPHTHPGPNDIFLLIEVSDASLEFDRTIKLELYARAAIREVWIVNLTSDVVLVHRMDGRQSPSALMGLKAASRRSNVDSLESEHI
jgi:hypothetical protein